MEICFNEVHICVCLWNKKYILSLRFKLVKVGGYDFLRPCDGHWNSHLFYKRSLVDTEFDKPGVEVDRRTDLDYCINHLFMLPVRVRNSSWILQVVAVVVAVVYWQY
jgi:hypothetical protein